MCYFCKSYLKPNRLWKQWILLKNKTNQNKTKKIFNFLIKKNNDAAHTAKTDLSLKFNPEKPYAYAYFYC